MSAIIGVCGTNFCTFVGDTRKMKLEDGEWILDCDGFRKVVRYSDSLLFGVTGFLNRGEKVLKPLSRFKHPASVSMQMAANATMEYCQALAKRGEMPGVRNYLIGGKVADGRYMIHCIHADPQTGEISFRDYRPGEPPMNFATVLSLPEIFNPYYEQWSDMVALAIRQSKSLEELQEHLCGIVAHLADVDGSISRDRHIVTLK